MILQVDDPPRSEEWTTVAFSAHESLAWHGTYSAVRCAVDPDSMSNLIVLRSSFEAINFARIAQAQAHRRKTFFRNDNSALQHHCTNLNRNRELH